MMNCDSMREFSSFRDPAGYIHRENGILYRDISAAYIAQYDMLMSSGLYDALTKFHAIIPHEEITRSENGIKIKPQELPLISYPYEWSFGMLKDAALLTLKIHRRAMQHGMVLKDASAYNIQFIQCEPVLIDTLSFDFYHEDEPWGAYGQFCRHFLAPLLLMKEKDARLNKLLVSFIDGIPLDLAAGLLNKKGGVFAKEHIVWHAKAISQHGEDGKKLIYGGKRISNIKLTRKQHLAVIESLIRGIEQLSWKETSTEWGDYYANTNYSSVASAEKQRIVEALLGEINPEMVWDMGANDGTYSKLALRMGAQVAAFDIDPVAVERNYQQAKNRKEGMLPLIMDMTNPSPGIGFANRERTPIHERRHPDCLLALAVIHHLAISNNLPFGMIAEWFAGMGKFLIVEFVPKEDSQVQILLATRTDIFPEYHEAGFEEAFSKYYRILKKQTIKDSMRLIYLMEVIHGGHKEN